MLFFPISTNHNSRFSFGVSNQDATCARIDIFHQFLVSSISSSMGGRNIFLPGRFFPRKFPDFSGGVEEIANPVLHYAHDGHVWGFPGIILGMGLSQWEKALLCNAFSQWPSPISRISGNQPGVLLICILEGSNKCILNKRPSANHIGLNWWLGARLQHLQCISNGDTAVLH